MANAVMTKTTVALVRRYADELRRHGATEATIGARDQLIERLREEGRLSANSIQFLLSCLQPGGEKRVLPNESLEQAVARLIGHYGWDERTARFTLALADGWSDLVPVADDGTPLPYFRHRDDEA